MSGKPLVFSVDTPRLQTFALEKRYGGELVVDQVSLRIAPGRVTCLLGPSGCGKSTTLRMIAGVEMQDRGEIHVDGKLICDTVTRVPPEQRGIGLMFQDFALFPHLSVGENVGFGLQNKGATRSARIGELLERVGLSHYLNAYPHELSGGEQQRVALARALAPNPRIMLMDEPFSGLDNRLRDGIRDETLALLKESGTSVLLVTHEPEEAMRMADEIALMRMGRIAQLGAPYNIYHAPVDKEAVAFFSDVNVITGLVKNGRAHTAFGWFAAPEMAEGSAVEIVCRPQHIGIDFDRNGHGPNPSARDGLAQRASVLRARFMGTESLVEFRLEHDGSLLKATVPNVFLPGMGRKMWLTLRRDKCFMFPASGTNPSPAAALPRT